MASSISLIQLLGIGTLTYKKISKDDLEFVELMSNSREALKAIE